MTRTAPTVVVVALLAATAVAFVFTGRLKLEDSPIQNTRLDLLVSPVCKACSPAAREARIAFRLRKEDHVTVDIVDAQGSLVREALVSGRYTPRFLRFAWDGRDGRGRLVADGLYRARVTLAEEGRTLEFPNEIRVDGTAPTIEDIKVTPQVISPDGDRRSDRATISYRFAERAYAVLYVDGKRSARSFRAQSAGVLQWYGLRGGSGLPPGTHRLALAAQDPPGNLSPSTREFEVRIRYVDIARPVYRVRPGARFRVRVSTDARTIRYSLGRVDGVVRAVRAVRRFGVRAPRRPGRYLLTVRVGNRLSRARVIVAR